MAVHCPYCGAAVEEGFIFCEKCGKRIPVKSQQEAAPESTPKPLGTEDINEVSRNKKRKKQEPKEPKSKRSFWSIASKIMLVPIAAYGLRLLLLIDEIYFIYAPVRFLLLLVSSWALLVAGVISFKRPQMQKKLFFWELAYYGMRFLLWIAVM